ncbi:hypothetical protein ON010_g10712 [Phytophthora cinnamomi]|nr:hypothetical protein ON010_g10712 [Phytophthora cinnamomi]
MTAKPSNGHASSRRGAKPSPSSERAHTAWTGTAAAHDVTVQVRQTEASTLNALACLPDKDAQQPATSDRGKELARAPSSRHTVLYTPTSCRGCGRRTAMAEVQVQYPRRRARVQRADGPRGAAPRRGHAQGPAVRGVGAAAAGPGDHHELQGRRQVLVPAPPQDHGLRAQERHEDPEPGPRLRRAQAQRALRRRVRGRAGPPGSGAARRRRAQGPHGRVAARRRGREPHRRVRGALPLRGDAPRGRRGRAHEAAGARRVLRALRRRPPRVGREPLEDAAALLQHPLPAALLHAPAPLGGQHAVALGAHGLRPHRRARAAAQGPRRRRRGGGGAGAAGPSGTDGGGQALRRPAARADPALHLGPDLPDGERGSHVCARAQADQRRAGDGGHGTGQPPVPRVGAAGRPVQVLTAELRDGGARDLVADAARGVQPVQLDQGPPQGAAGGVFHQRPHAHHRLAVVLR